MREALKNWIAEQSADELASYRFEFNVPFGNAVAIALIILALVGASVFFWRRLDRLPKPLRVFLVALRGVGMALALFLLLDPCIVAERIKPGEHYVVMLFDDSKSMQIMGDDGKSRGERMREAYAAQSEAFEQALRQRYQLALYRFGEGLERIKSVDDLDFEQRESKIARSVDDALMDLEGIAVSGVIVFSDGIEQSAEGATEVARAVSDQVPVYTVGVDSESRWRDLEIGDIGVRKTQFDKSPLVLTAPIKATGFAGGKGVVEVLLDGRRVMSQTIEINDDTQEAVARLEFIPDRKGWLDYEVRVGLGEPELESELDQINEPDKDRVLQNNSRRFVVDNREKIFRILYLSGRPNWENKFVHHALQEDDELRLTSLIRISKAEKTFTFRGQRSSGISNPLFEGFDGDQEQPRYDEAVFLRLGIEGSELAKGYPMDEEELFPYDLVIWGDIEHDFFDQRHFEVTRDFVRKRGGTFLVLGGPDAFTEGKYDRTMIETMLPVMLHDSEDLAQLGGDTTQKNYRAAPTVDGVLSGVLSLSPNPQENRSIWEEMPELSGINLFALTRAGATVFAEAVDEAGALSRGTPLFVHQRYGEGKVAVLAAFSTFQWQMRLDNDDTRHERFWRQLVRHLVADVPAPIVFRNKRDAYTVGQTANFEFLVRDNLFDEREALQTEVNVVMPSGAEVSLAVDESIHEAGLYTSEFNPDEAGMALVSLVADNDKGERVGEFEQAVLVQPDQREFQSPQYNPARLEQVAGDTGGGFFELDEIARIPGEIPWIDRKEPDEMRIHMWRLPGLYIALVLIFLVDWLLRRLRGYA